MLRPFASMSSVEPQAEGRSPGVHGGAPPGVEAGFRALVVSDDPAVRAEAVYGFPEDVEVRLARDSRDAWREMRSGFVPSVVVVDIQTGSSGGFGLAREMAQDRELSRVPVLMLIERRQDGWLARQSGAAAFRVKPLDSSELARSTLVLALHDSPGPGEVIGAIPPAGRGPEETGH